MLTNVEKECVNPDLTAIADGLLKRTEPKLEAPIVQDLFRFYRESGLLHELSTILLTIEDSERAPIVHTLTSHVTKEKPLFVYALSGSSHLSESQIRTLSASVDLLWTLSLMYDDIIDHDLQRAGDASAWVMFGPQATLTSVERGMERIRDRITAECNSCVCSRLMTHITRGLHSIEEHGDMTLETTSPSDILNNYQRRADFHTAFPVEVLHNDVAITAQTHMTAICGVNIAGQILNDMKDTVRDYEWIRTPFSDIRSGRVTYPTVILWELLPSFEKRRLSSLMGKEHLTKDDERFLTTSMRDTGALTQVAQMIANLYGASRNAFRACACPGTMSVIDGWFDYKHGQLATIA